MDIRRIPRTALLALTLLASGAACANGGDDSRAQGSFAAARHGLRLVTRLIRAPAPVAPVETSITAGVRG